MRWREQTAKEAIEAMFRGEYASKCVKQTKKMFRDRSTLTDVPCSDINLDEQLVCWAMSTWLGIKPRPAGS